MDRIDISVKHGSRVFWKLNELLKETGVHQLNGSFLTPEDLFPLPTISGFLKPTWATRLAQHKSPVVIVDVRGATEEFLTALTCLNQDSLGLPPTTTWIVVHESV
jgi:hypothetical protein